jgi:hypothetical protein
MISSAYPTSQRQLVLQPEHRVTTLLPPHQPRPTRLPMRGDVA